ncbi:MAG: 50S ribosomal protein L15e [Candidatus Nanoarchaeia archaeon]|nr:50S ribosomal protein L15e [Candidatus Nanoarchaeia archaeon]MDD5740361.1 50S ribosomal protein L15e [Candidatus Nanoarchaeia archaeon]
MSKGMYHHIRAAWRNPDIETLRSRMIKWREGNSIVKVDKPLRLDKARSLGYKAKKGFIVARIRILRGGRKRPRPRKGRKGRKLSNKLVLKMNYQWVAEQRVQRKFVNLEVLNSYNIGKDGTFYFYEVILVDPERPEIKNDRTMSWITQKQNKNRVLRGLTSAAKKSRGLRTKTHNLKVRPSLNAWHHRGK